jgi:hypothetical protein
MLSNLDSIFDDESFDDLTKQEEKKKHEILDPDILKFQEIIDFVKENGREPQQTPEWTKERALWARLCGFRDKKDRAEKVKKYDDLDLLSTDNLTLPKNNGEVESTTEINDIEDILGDDLLKDDFAGLLDVSRYRKTINAADKIGRRKHARNFEKFEKLFEEVYADIASGKRKIIPFEQYDIQEGHFYVQNGVMLYVEKIGEFYTDKVGERNAKMHVVYENGTENKSLLFRSLASSLYSTKRYGRMVTDIVDENTLAKRFGEEYTTGYIYVLQSLSPNEEISKLKNLYKIGFTRDAIEKRIANAENEVTYLYAPVRVVLSAEIKNVNSQKLERTLHHIFEDRQVIFQDDSYKKATEWYVIPLDEIQKILNEIFVGLHEK